MSQFKYDCFQLEFRVSWATLRRKDSDKLVDNFSAFPQRERSTELRLTFPEHF
eukprot:gene13960-15416_t